MGTQARGHLVCRAVIAGCKQSCESGVGRHRKTARWASVVYCICIWYERLRSHTHICWGWDTCLPPALSSCLLVPTFHWILSQILRFICVKRHLILNIRAIQVEEWFFFFSHISIKWHITQVLQCNNKCCSFGALNVDKHLCLEYNEWLSYTKRLCGLPCDARFVMVWQKLTNRSIFFPSEDGILSC